MSYIFCPSLFPISLIMRKENERKPESLLGSDFSVLRWMGGKRDLLCGKLSGVVGSNEWAQDISEE